ncbi:protein phosphatase 2C domain-containing protein [Limnobaculum zhutongyuii]|uniref:Protein phosphatase 2C domain-containing protein n=1 Tax=Limnobaculum zhutongyuii TaxID=2498113 RepID=A0A411WN38_9GAMM|nr:PP2C family serine/threonine-protein phosphatase [Limnobaculum zhutongyuii]QBH97505.1 protein phosphatase 2C domain-containing protein [Limnobaculum zhutongyuii]TQS90980.1 protein phosphatase 2C domain-containing protein [Limnobaculum zhutongyuii]
MTHNTRALLTAGLSNVTPRLSELQLSHLEKQPEIQHILSRFSQELNEKVQQLNAPLPLSADPIEQAEPVLEIAPVDEIAPAAAESDITTDNSPLAENDSETALQIALVAEDIIICINSETGTATETSEPPATEVAVPILPLRPGQVPAQSAAPATAPKEASMPKVNFAFANARVGTAYLSKIDASSHYGDPVTVQEIKFNQDIGISFNPETQELYGTPTIDGDYQLFIKWTIDGKSSHSSEALMIVNPDPRSLWKIIEPPADDKYFKPNTDNQMIDQDGVKIAAVSRRGRSHEHVGSFRDDDFFISHDSETDWSIMIVADGAGSAQNSRRGSQLASQTAGSYLSKQMQGELGHKLKSLIQDWQPESQKQIGPLFSDLYRNAAKLAVNAIESEAIDMAQTTKSYSTTLLATVSIRINDELFAAAFWMGDGAIAAYGPVGKVRLLGMPDSGEYAGQTRFLDNDAINDSSFNNRIMIGKWTEITYLILMTDGVSDPYFETDNGLISSDKWDLLVNEILPCLQSDQAAEKLTEWLNFFSPGNHDDRTIAVSW